MSEKVLTELLCTSLPKAVQNKSDESTLSSDSEFTVKSFLKSALPPTDVKLIDSELNKKLLLAKNRQKPKVQKPRLKKTHLSFKERKALGLYKLKKDDIKYEDFTSLNTLWQQYFSDYLDLKSLRQLEFTGQPDDKHWDHISRLLTKADYHGSILTVVRSKCSSLVGKEGIVVIETKNTFQLISQNNSLIVVPKKDSVFTLRIYGFKLTIFGKNFCIRPSERSVKKIKSFMKLDL